MSQPPDNYVHGHHESVLRSHTSRTVENSAAYLADHLRPGMRLLDVGCGPGTITVGLADRVAPGEVLGLDPVADVLETARQLDVPANCRFDVGDVYELDHADGSFDVVHAHQVLQHLRRPVDALVEMGRVTKPGGIVAVRDADYAAMHWAPAAPALDRWQELYHQICAHNEVEPDAGRYLMGWAQRAGFTDIEVSTTAWTFATPATREWWAGLWADRVTKSTFATESLALGLATEGELETLADGFRAWAAAEDAVFIVSNTEVLAFKR